MSNNNLKRAFGFFAAAVMVVIIFPIVTSGAAISTIIYKTLLAVFIGIGCVYGIWWVLDKLDAK